MTLAVLLSPLLSLAESEGATIAVEVVAPMRALLPGESFTLDLVLDPAGLPLTNWQFSLDYDPAALEVLSVTHVPARDPGTDVYGFSRQSPERDGFPLTIGCTFPPDYCSRDRFVAATVTFRVAESARGGTLRVNPVSALSGSVLSYWEGDLVTRYTPDYRGANLTVAGSGNDPNGDGALTIEDASFLLALLSSRPAQDLAAFDLTGDGALGMKDLSALLRAIEI